MCPYLMSFYYCKRHQLMNLSLKYSSDNSSKILSDHVVRNSAGNNSQGRVTKTFDTVSRQC